MIRSYVLQKIVMLQFLADLHLYFLQPRFQTTTLIVVEPKSSQNSAAFTEFLRHHRTAAAAVAFNWWSFVSLLWGIKRWSREYNDVFAWVAALYAITALSIAAASPARGTKQPGSGGGDCYLLAPYHARIGVCAASVAPGLRFPLFVRFTFVRYLLIATMRFSIIVLHFLQKMHVLFCLSELVCSMVGTPPKKWCIGNVAI